MPLILCRPRILCNAVRLSLANPQSLHFGLPIGYYFHHQAWYLRACGISETLSQRKLPAQPGHENGVFTVSKKPAGKNKESDGFGKDRRRKHHHFLVTVFYADGERFGRVYTNKDKAARFAERQRRSPVVKSARISMVS